MQRKIVTILLVLSFLLLAIKIIIGLFNKEEQITVVTDVNSSVIDSLFLNSLKDFSLDSNWIEKKFIKDKSYDSINYVYHIKTPGDLPVTVLLQYLNKQYERYPVDLYTEERIINRNSVLNIYSNDVLKLQAHFYTDSKAERDHTKFAFIIENYNDIDDERKEQILKSKYVLTVLSVPSKETLELKAMLNKNNKKICIEINDDINDKEYKLEKSTSKILLKEGIRRIIRDFPEADLFVIDINSSLYQSAVYNFIRDQFAEGGVRLYLKSDFISLPDDLQEAASLFDFHFKSGINKNGKILLIDGNTFLSLKERLNEAKMKGTKFYFPSELIELNEKNLSD